MIEDHPDQEYVDMVELDEEETEPEEVKDEEEASALQIPKRKIKDPSPVW